MSPLLLALIGAAAAAGAGLCVVWALAKRQASLERRLAGYEPIGMSTTPMKASDLDLAPETRLVSSAMDFTKDLAKRTGILARVELMLETADVPVRPAEFVFYVPVVAITLGILVGVAFNWLTGIVFAAIVGAAPVAWVHIKRDRRIKQFDAQLPDGLNLLASSMRAGFSFMQGLEAVASEARDPLKRELHRAFTEARLGRPVDVALEDCAIRMKSGDLQWVVLALRIQREVGGNLAELLVTVADTMTQRERLRREIGALTAEGRFSAIILSIMPFFFLLLFQVLQPDYVPKLFHKPLGVIALIGAVIGNIVGWFWLRRIVDIEV